MLAELRSTQASGWVNQFLQDYRLNTSEGIALLSLAEAFLRVTDPETAHQLVAAKLGEATWRAQPGKAHSTLVHRATSGLVVGRDLVKENDAQSARERASGAAGGPFSRQACGDDT